MSNKIESKVDKIVILVLFLPLIGGVLAAGYVFIPIIAIAYVIYILFSAGRAAVLDIEKNVEHFIPRSSSRNERGAAFAQIEAINPQSAAIDQEALKAWGLPANEDGERAFKAILSAIHQAKNDKLREGMACYAILDVMKRYRDLGCMSEKAFRRLDQVLKNEFTVSA